MERWDAYLEKFPEHFKAHAIRPGCEPLIHKKNANAEHGIVLIHGLTDSPHFMRAIGECFAGYGFNVYLPLLQCHGLKEPNGMKGVSLDAWKKNVNYAVEQCQQDSKRVSIGGLSTGGALSVWKAMTDEVSINGAIFLFSAALDLAGKSGNFKEWLTRSFIGRVIDFAQDLKEDRLIGPNPYRYRTIDVGGAGELSELIQHLDQLIDSKGDQDHVAQPAFVAHSAFDSTADIQGVKDFLKICSPDRSQFYPMCTQEQIEAGEPGEIKHAEVVLKDDVKDKDGNVLEKHNPMFTDMMGKIEQFVGRHLLGS